MLCVATFISYTAFTMVASSFVLVDARPEVEEGQSGTLLVQIQFGLGSIKIRQPTPDEAWLNPNTETNDPIRSSFHYNAQLEGVDRNATERILAKNGYFFGASRDSWIVLGICVGGLLVAYFVIIASVHFATKWRADVILSVEIPYKAAKITKPEFEVDFVQRVILKRELNPLFAERASLASRCAVACALLGLTYWVPSFTFMNSKGWSMQYVAVIICFSVYRDTGTTVNLAWQNFYGTLLPTFNVFLLYGLFPHGTSGAGVGSAAFYFGLIDLIIFCGAFLAMNWPAGVRMFALSWQAYFSMCFLNPHDTTVFSHGLSDVILEGAAVGPLIGTVFGCVIAILITAPSPLNYCTTALGAAQETSMSVAWEELQQWNRLVQCFLGLQPTLTMGALAVEAHEIREKLQELDTLLASAWYECLDAARPGQIRSHLLALQETFRTMHDWLDTGIHAVCEQAANSSRPALLTQVGTQLQDLSDFTSALLFRAAGLAATGQTAKYDKEISEAIKRVRSVQKDLAKQLEEARMAVYGIDGVNATTIRDHTFIFAVSAYGRHVVEFAEYLLEENDAARPHTSPLFKGCWMGIKDTVQFNNARFIFRSSFAFFLAWALGYVGWRNIFHKYSATAAGTTAFLMAAEGKRGSASMKNVARFQGVAAGSMLGLIIYRALVTCEHGAILAIGVFGAYEFCAFYLYFASSTYGYVGLLMAAFGAEAVLLDCSQQGLAASANVYKALLDQTGAILCVTLADLLVGNTSAAIVATGDFFDLMHVLKASLERLLGTRVRPTEANVFHEINEKIMQAAAHAVEAELEPRFGRIPFKSNLWRELCHNGKQLAHSVCIMEYVESETAGTDVLKVLHDVPALRKELAELDDRAETCLRVAEQVMQNDTVCPPAAKDYDVEKLLKKKAPFTQALEDTMEDINQKLVEQQRECIPENVMQEDCGRAEVLLYMLSNIYNNINEIEELILTRDNASLQKYFACASVQQT